MGWALTWSGRRTAALATLISVAEDATRDQPALAWDALGERCDRRLPVRNGAGYQAVSRALDLLERQDPHLGGQIPGA